MIRLLAIWAAMCLVTLDRASAESPAARKSEAVPQSKAVPIREAVPTGPVARWRLDLRLDKPSVAGVTLWLTSVGDRVTAAWCLDPVLPPKNQAFQTLLLDPAGLRASETGITGSLTARLRVDQNVYTAPRAITVSVTASAGGPPTGRIEGTVRTLSVMGGENSTKSATVVGGQRWTEAELRTSDALPEKLSWPCWMGPNQNFSATSTTTPVIRDIGQARLVWKSEYVGPTEMGSYRYGLCAGRLPAEGGASPLVAGGRVFVFRVVPTGDVYSRHHVEKCLADPKYADQVAKMARMGIDDPSLRATWAIDADEQVLALDASTGRTLWKTTFPRAGLHMHDHKCGLTNHTGYATADRVFVFGSLGVVRCLSAADGALFWQANIPGYHEEQSRLKATCLAQQHANVPTRSFCHALNAAEAEGVLLVPTGPGDCGLMALTMSDGKPLWTVQDRILSSKATPIIWRGADRTLVLAVRTNPVDGEGTLTALDAKTGAIAWTVRGLGSNENQSAIDGDVLILNDSRVSKGTGDGHEVQKTGRMAAWKITATGAEKLWTAPDGSGMSWYRPTAAIDGGVAAVRHVRTIRLIEVATGRVLSTDELPTGRQDESHTSAMNGVFFPEKDSQHGSLCFYTRPHGEAGKLSALWSPPHPQVTTYAVSMSHAWVDGRLFIRGRDGVYCYDIRAVGQK